MRVLFSTDYFHPHVGGGVERVVHELAWRASEMGHEVMVLTLDTAGGPKRASMDGFSVTRFRSTQLTGKLGVQLAFSFEARRHLVDVVADFRPDVVNAHNRFFSLTPLVIRAAGELRIPVVVTLHLGGLDALAGWTGIAARRYESWIGRRVLSGASGVLAVGSAVADHARVLTRGQVPVSVVPNGAELVPIRSMARQPSHDAVRGLFVGRLISNKGPHVLLEALRSWKDRPSPLVIDIAGEGPMRSELERRARRYGVADIVRFLGYRDDIGDLLSQSDFLVRPSLLEGMPLVSLEAMAAGIPVVMSDVGATSDVVVDGTTGLLVEPGSVDSLRVALATLVSDRDRMRSMGEAGRERVACLPGWAETASRALESLDQVRRSAHV